jgi:hypothetical protein
MNGGNFMRTTTVYGLLSSSNTEFSNMFVPGDTYDNSIIQNPDNIWARYSNIYYSDTYRLSKNDKSWTSDVYWNHLSFSGKYIWSYNNKIYYSPGGHANYSVGGDNWLPATAVSGLTEGNSFFGRFVENYGSITLYNDCSNNRIYKLDENSNTWIQLYNGLGSPEYVRTPSMLWSDGKSIYCSDDNWQYKLNTDRNVWESKYWTENGSSRSSVLEYGDRTWSIGDTIYYSLYGNHYVLDKENSNWTTTSWTFEDKYPSLDGGYIWSHNGNTYYSNGKTQYILDGTLWKLMTWENVNNFYSYNLWTLGDNVYYSYNGSNYVLNGTTWEPMTWLGSVPSNLDAREVYTINGDIYYSKGGSKHYKLEGTTWSEIDRPAWGTFTSFNGNFVWTDGSNTYYSNNDSHFIFNGETWEPTTWNGLNTFSGTDIWLDGSNTYYSDGVDNYILNGDTWTKTTFSGTTSLRGRDIWTDGACIYYTTNGVTYNLLPKSTKVYTKLNGSWLKIGSLPETTSTTT